MDGHCLLPYTCKCCIVFKQFADGLNFDGLAGKCQKRQNFPVKILRYMVYHLYTQIIKFTLNFLCIGGEIYLDIDKSWRSDVSFLCMLLKYL